jgi:hypothetical protein
VLRLRRNAARHPGRWRDSQDRERYFTDGSNLYRFLEWLTSSGNARLAAFEDCRTLGLVLVNGDWLTQARLRPVP